MMKQFLLLLVLTVSVALSSEGQVTTRTRSWEKTFQVSERDTLEIQNFLGNVTVIHKAQNNQVSVKINLTVSSSSNPEYPEFIYNNLDVRTEHKANVLSIESVLRKVRVWHNIAFNHSMDYVVSVPYWMPVKITQHTGNIYMPKENFAPCELFADMGSIYGGDFSGPLKATVSYGELIIGVVGRADIDLERSKSSEIGNAADLRARMSYSTLTVRKANRLQVDAEHCKLNASAAMKAVLNLRYTNCRLEWLLQSLTCNNLQYGTLDICHLSPDFNMIDVTANYGHLNIELPKQSSFTVKPRNTVHCRIDVTGFEYLIDNGDKIYDILVNGARGGTITFNANNNSDLMISAEK